MGVLHEEDMGLKDVRHGILGLFAVHSLNSKQVPMMLLPWENLSI